MGSLLPCSSSVLRRRGADSSTVTAPVTEPILGVEDKAQAPWLVVKTALPNKGDLKDPRTKWVRRIRARTDGRRIHDPPYVAAATAVRITRIDQMFARFIGHASSSVPFGEDLVLPPRRYTVRRSNPPYVGATVRMTRIDQMFARSFMVTHHRVPLSGKISCCHH